MGSKFDARIMAERGKALEEAFFARHEKTLLEQSRQAADIQARRAALAAASGIHDDDVLDRLVSLELSPETVAALGLVPLVEVAWADGSLDTKERDAVVEAATEAGVEDGTPAHDLLEEWLDRRPPGELMALWKDTVRVLQDALEPEERTALRDELLGRAQRVAEAAGGILGLGKVSAEERRMLSELEKAFSP